VGLATGQYTLVAEIDSGNALVESDETNNTVALAGTMEVY
jgi:subtilase family serine protease